MLRLHCPEKLLSEELEQKYRAACWRRDIYTAMICQGVCLAFLFLSLWYDMIILQSPEIGTGIFFVSIISLISALRIISIVFTLILMVWLYKSRNHFRFAAYDKYVFTWLLLNAGLVLLAEFTRPVWYYVGAVSHTALVMMLYLVLPLHSLILRILTPLLFTAAYFFIYANFKSPVPLLGFSGIYLGFILINILGIIVSSMTHSSNRRQFVLDLEKDQLVTLLAEGKEKLEQKNRELEREKELVACYEAEMRKQEVQREKMRTLQAQIKPHFLYNTLSTIGYYCRHQPEQAYALINDLSIYLQGSFKLHNEQIPLEHELELVQAYLGIESARMEDRLKVEFAITGDFSRCRLPPFTIQPLVENAVRHGLAPQPEGGVLKVIAREEEDCYYLAVSDNGVGIAKEKQVVLLSPRDKDSNGGIGLANVHERLVTLCGSGLNIDSRVKGGTTVSFTIAKRGMET